MKHREVLEKIARGRHIAAFFLAGAITLTSVCTVQASKTIKDAESKKSEAQQNLNAVNEEIEDIENAQSGLQAEMEAYDSQLMALLTDMDLLQTDMDNKQVEIEQAKTDLAAAEDDEAEQYEAMCKRIQYMYENGNQSFLTVLIESQDITEFLNRAEYVSDVYDYDRELLTAYQDTVQQVTELTAKLENEMSQMEELQLSYEEQESSLNQVISEKSAQIADFDRQLSTAKSLAAEYAATIRQQNQVIAAEQERQRQEEAAKKAAEEKKKQEQLAAATKASARNTTASASKDEGTGSSGTKASGTSSSDTGTKGTGSGGTDSASTGTDTDSGTGSTATDSSTGSSTAYSASSTSGAASSGSTGTGSSAGSTTGLTDGDLNPSFSSGVSGGSVVSYASNFLGNPYVYGGNSLTEGTDCSGFVSLVYQHFGISLPRSSYALQQCGQAVSYANAQPGDLICYPGHVAIYVGGGTIIHASTPSSGICYGNATYRTISTVRRVL